VSDGPTLLNPDDLPIDDIYPITPTPDVVAAMEEDSHAYADAQRWKWLESTRQLQEEFYGAVYPIKGEALADYVTWNHSALVLEASELLSEFQWKNWTKSRGDVNRTNALKEAVDVAHFLGNILNALDVTDQEWEDAYQKKQEVNRQRQREGYDGVSGKCSVCRRSYDDQIECTPAETVTEVNASGSFCVELEIKPAHCAYR
jgi:dimeric dUTPase (all-alpha-NTP-PPase superfamily)